MELRKRLLSMAVMFTLVILIINGSTMELSSVNEDDTQLFQYGNKETIYLWYGDEELTDYLNGAAVSFGEQEEVRVIPVLTSDHEYLEAINRASLEGEHVPDVYLTSSDTLEKAYLSGLCSEIRDTRNICTEKHFFEAALSAVTYKGKKLAYPIYYDTSALVYNQSYLMEWAKQQAEKELVETDENSDGESDFLSAEAENGLDETMFAKKTQEYFQKAIPTTVDDILNIADTFDAPEGVENIMKWDVADILYNYWMVGQYIVVGGDCGDNDEAINIYNDEAVSCLEAYKNLNQFFFIESDYVTYDSVIQEFIDGKTVFTIGTTDVVKRLEDAKKNGDFAYEYGVTVMPDVSTDLKSRSLSVTNVAVVNGYSEQKELANQFATYLAEDYTDSLYRWTGKLSTNVNANKNIANLQVFAQEYANSVTLPKMVETGNFWLQLELLFAKVWNGADVKTVLQELAEQITLQTQATAS